MLILQQYNPQVAVLNSHNKFGGTQEPYRIKSFIFRTFWCLEGSRCALHPTGTLILGRWATPPKKGEEPRALAAPSTLEPEPRLCAAQILGLPPSAMRHAEDALPSSQLPSDRPAASPEFLMLETSCLQRGWPAKEAVKKF